MAHDLPAVFNYVYGQTRQKINYVGHSLVIFLIKEMQRFNCQNFYAKLFFHSMLWTFQRRVWQGTLLALASLSQGKLVDHVKSVALLSPVAYLSHMSTPLGVVAARTFAGEVHF